MVPPRGFKNYLRDIFAAKLVGATRFATNRDEEGCAEPSVKTDCVI